MDKNKNKNKDPQYVHLTYPYDRPGPKKTDPKLNVQKTLRQFNYATPSLKGISEIPWKDITACTINSGGSPNGAILLQTHEGNFAIKGSTNPALEYFAFQVFKELKIRAPAMRVLQHTEEDFKLAIDFIQKASYADLTLKHKVREVLNRPFLLLMEYVPAQKIYQLGEKRARMCFDPAYPDGRDRLIRLGITYAVDTLLNIRDRYPLIWGTTGNPENMLIGFNTNWVNTNEELFDRNNTELQMTFLSPIDNKPILIGKKTEMSQDAYDLYLQEFEKVVKYSFEGLRPVKEGRINPFDSTTKRFDYASLSSTFIYNQSSHDIKTLGELQILLGLVIGFVNIANMTFQRIERMKKRTVGVLKVDWKNLWMDDCENIRLDIIKEEIRIIEKYMFANEEIIAWVSTITLNNYFLTFEKLKEEDGNESIALDDKSFSGQGISSKNVDEYDEWLEKKIDQYFGLSQPMEQYNQGQYQQGDPQQQVPASPTKDMDSSRTGRSGKKQSSPKQKGKKSPSRGKSGRSTPGESSPTNKQRSPSPEPIQQPPPNIEAQAQPNPNPVEEGKQKSQEPEKKKKKKGFFW